MSSNVPEAGGAKTALHPDCRVETLAVAFFDLERMAEWAGGRDDTEIAAFLQRVYELAADHVDGAGGRVVKYIGDAGLVVFPPDRLAAGIQALYTLGRAVREHALRVGFDTHMVVNMHVGPVVAGPFGPAGAERFDVIGKTVNVAARLGRKGVTLSPQAFRSLDDDARKRFKKITRPATYRLAG